MKKVSVLLKTMMLSTSQWNIYKYTDDKKKKGRVVGNTVGMVVLFIMLMGYSIAQCIGYGMFGLTDSIPVMCALVISALGFFLTFLKVNGYLFNFKEYDMLMSLPFKPRDVAACKFLYMYIKSLPWYMGVSLSMMIVYGVYSKASILTFLIWIVSTIFLPLIPMVAATFLGFIITKIGSGFKNKTLGQTVITFIFILLIFVLEYGLQYAGRTGKMGEVMGMVSEATDSVCKWYHPAKWFKDAVSDLNFVYMLLLIVISLAIFAVVFVIVGSSYRKINSALKSHGASHEFEMKDSKSRSVVGTIAFKEFKRMTGSTIYMTNGCVGELMCLVGGIAVLFLDIDKLISKMLMGAPITKEMLIPAIPFIVYFLVGMVATTAFTPSLEGKNYWIVQSLPISKKTLYQGKMLFNMMLTVPFTVFAIISLSISMKAGLLSTVLSVVLGILLCAYSTTWGCVCGIKHMRLDWENEVEVIKQRAAVAVYLFPNMFGTMILMVATVMLGTRLNHNLIFGIMIVIFAALAGLFYKMVMKLCERK